MTLGGVEAPKASLDGMVDKRLWVKIEHLNELFPQRSTSEIKNSLASCNGNFDDALDLLSGSPGSSQSAASESLSQNNAIIKVKNDYETLEDFEDVKTREKVAMLLDLCIAQPIPILIDILGNYDWDVDRAANILLNDYTLPDRHIEGNHESVEGVSQIAGDGASVASTGFDPTPPSTPPSPTVQQRYPGGVMPSLVLSLRHSDENPQSQTEPQEPQPRESHEQSPELTSSSSSIDDLSNKQHPESIHLGGNAATNKQGGEQQAQRQIYGFGNDIEMIREETIELKVERLHELLPRATKRRCKAILQLWPDIDEAFGVLFEEIAEHGSDESGAETGDENDDSETSSEEFETERPIPGRDHRASGIGSGSRRDKRRAETPEEEPPTKKSRLVIKGEKDEEAEAAKLEPAGEWVLNTFGESRGIQIVLKSGQHPCKFPKGLLSRHFSFCSEQLKTTPSEPTAEPREETIDLPDVDREVFDLAIQLAITKSFQLHKAQSKTRSTEITAVLELVTLTSRLGLSGAGYIIAARLKEVLLDRRNSLQGEHIELAYTLKKGHPIRKVIVQSLGRAYFILRQPPESKKRQLYRRGEGDNARRNAFGAERFMFQDQLDSIDDFNLELSTQAIDIMHDRNELMSRSGKTRTITYTDPLSEEEFSL